MTDESSSKVTRPTDQTASQSDAAAAPTPTLSVVVTFDSDRFVQDTMDRYRVALDAQGLPYEILCVFDAGMTKTKAGLEELATTWPQLEPVAQRPWIDEDAAMAFAVKRARADLTLTLPSWLEVDPAEINTLIDSLENNDMVVAQRNTSDASSWQRWRKDMLQGLIRVLFGHKFADVFCRVRLGRTDMFRQISQYGVRQHFLPLLAVSNGYKVTEIATRSAPADSEPTRYHFKPLAHISALLDILSLYVVLKFLKRPLRFFGSIGLLFAGLGTALTGWLVFARLFLGEPLADRPALIFGVMMIVLGVQVIALGLIGEIVIFSSSRRAKLYDVEKVVGRDDDQE